ncbi:MAG: rhamnan synthesis F family protein [Steroidobacteraceae bacterium]
MTDSDAAAESLRLKWRKIRRKLREQLPYIKRKKYTLLIEQHHTIQAQLNELIKTHDELIKTHYPLLATLRGSLLGQPAIDKLATSAGIQFLLPMSIESNEEVCFFVSFCPTTELKPHVLDHVMALHASGIKVVLILNTSHPAEMMRVPDTLIKQLAGLIVRENLGFDFSAWAHALQLSREWSGWQRLYLINDSLVGPFEHSAFATMLQKIRNSQADLVGLTENSQPLWHLQSFFLVIGPRILQSPLFANMIKGTLNLPRKEDVIDCYEMQLAAFFTSHGFSHETIFPNFSTDPYTPDDTLFRWEQLIERGFPYIKASVLAKVRHHPHTAQLIPARYQ